MRKEAQRILAVQQSGSGENKIKGIRQYGGDRYLLETFDILVPLPPVIDDGAEYLPAAIEADLVLDYLERRDLSYDLRRICERLGIPVVASNKQTNRTWAITPRTCCALPRRTDLGAYGKLFGTPEFQVTIVEGRIAAIAVLHGAPCGATWEAAKGTIGLTIEEAPMQIGLMVQYYCKANPASWDVVSGKSPLHFAAQLHKTALKTAIDRSPSGWKPYFFCALLTRVNAGGCILV